MTLRCKGKAYSVRRDLRPNPVTPSVFGNSTLVFIMISIGTLGGRFGNPWRVFRHCRVPSVGIRRCQLVGRSVGRRSDGTVSSPVPGIVSNTREIGFAQVDRSMALVRRRVRRFRPCLGRWVDGDSGCSRTCCSPNQFNLIFAIKVLHVVSKHCNHIAKVTSSAHLSTTADQYCI